MGTSTDKKILKTAGENATETATKMAENAAEVRGIDATSASKTTAGTTRAIVSGSTVLDALPRHARARIAAAALRRGISRVAPISRIKGTGSPTRGNARNARHGAAANRSAAKQGRTTSDPGAERRSNRTTAKTRA